MFLVFRTVVVVLFFGVAPCYCCTCCVHSRCRCCCRCCCRCRCPQAASAVRCQRHWCGCQDSRAAWRHPLAHGRRSRASGAVRRRRRRRQCAVTRPASCSCSCSCPCSCANVCVSLASQRLVGVVEDGGCVGRGRAHSGRVHARWFRVSRHRFPGGPVRRVARVPARLGLPWKRLHRWLCTTFVWLPRPLMSDFLSVYVPPSACVCAATR
jgi:hypothetical protein